MYVTATQANYPRSDSRVIVLNEFIYQIFIKQEFKFTPRDQLKVCSNKSHKNILWFKSGLLFSSSYHCKGKFSGHMYQLLQSISTSGIMKHISENNWNHPLFKEVIRIGPSLTKPSIILFENLAFRSKREVHRSQKWEKISFRLVQSIIKWIRNQE